MPFSDKLELLGLYNAVRGKQYKDPGSPCRSISPPTAPTFHCGCLYVADLYADLIKNENLYGRKKVKIPPPQFIISCNGEEKQPDRRILRLFDLYEVKEEEHKLEAVERTIKECIREGILEEFLRKY